MNIQHIKDWIDVLADAGLAELHLTEPDLELHLIRDFGVSNAEVAPHVTHSKPSAIARSQTAAPPPTLQEPAASAAQDKRSALAPVHPEGRVIHSPMVGTFYRASARGADPLTEVGAVIVAGAAVCVIESMKIFNEIDSDHAGTVKAVLCEDGQSVTTGQALMVIE